MKKAFFKRTFFKRTWILSVCLYTLLGHQSLTFSASGDSEAFAVGLIITTAAVVLRHQIKDTIVSAYKSLVFDKKQIPSVYTDAIVRIHGISTEPDCLSIMGTASIIRSERNSDDYFAITAAHCVEKTKFNRLQVKNPHYVAGGDSPRFIHVNAEPIIVDEVADTAVLHIPHEALQDFFQKTDNGPLPYIPASALSSAMPGKNEVLVAQGDLGSINNDRCYQKKMIAREPAFRFIRTPGDRTPRRSFLMGTFNCENLPGLSGGPVIMVKDKGAYIVGLFLGLYQRGFNRAYRAASFGQLPSYIRWADNLQAGAQQWQDELRQAIRQGVHARQKELHNQKKQNSAEQYHNLLFDAH